MYQSYELLPAKHFKAIRRWGHTKLLKRWITWTCRWLLNKTKWYKIRHQSNCKGEFLTALGISCGQLQTAITTCTEAKQNSVAYLEDIRLKNIKISQLSRLYLDCFDYVSGLFNLLVECYPISRIDQIILMIYGLFGALYMITKWTLWNAITLHLSIFYLLEENTVLLLNVEQNEVHYLSFMSTDTSTWVEALIINQFIYIHCLQIFVYLFYGCSTTKFSDRCASGSNAFTIA